MPLVTLFVVLALLVGAAIGYWMQASRIRPAQSEAERLRQTEMQLRATVAGLEAENKAIGQRLDDLRLSLETAEGARKQAESEIIRLREQIAQLSTALEKERKAAEEKLALIEDKFKILASDILKDKARELGDFNKTEISTLLKPVEEKFTEFKNSVESLKDVSISKHSELKTQIEGLRTLNERLSQDATNLVNALKGSSKTQGDWGELILEQLLEAAGLRKDQEYFVQETFDRDGNKRARLDVVLNLPGGRQIVIDSKASLNAYEAYCNSSDETLRNEALKQHLSSVRAHVKGLSKQNYHTLYGLKSLDFVIMFVPIEPAFMLAMANDNRLWQDAWDQNVLLVSRTTLLFVLRTIAYLWGQERQTRNIEKIVHRGGELYEKLAAFATELTDVGKSLDAARQSYDEAVKKLSTGRGNVIRQAEMLRELGIKPSKNIPTILVEAAMDTPPELASPLFDQPELNEDEAE